MKNKVKTHSGSKKRFKITGSGKIKRGHGYTSHNSKHKTHKQIRNLRKPALVAGKFISNVKRMLGK